MRSERLVGLAIAAALLAPAAASAECDEASLAELDARLANERRKARNYRLGWAVTYTALTAGQLGLIAAEWVPGQEFTESKEAALYIGASKTTIGALAQLVLPLKIPRRWTGGGDACNYAEKALAEAYLNERNGFILTVGGGLLLNVAGMVILGLAYDDWGEGAVSLALGLPVTALAAWTYPRRAWRSRGEWAISLDRSEDKVGMSLVTTW